MPAIKFSRAAVRDIERVIAFLENKNPKAAIDARAMIGNALESLARFPEVGQLIRENPPTRNLVTGFGKSGYVLRYRVDNAGTVWILRVWHGKEDR